MRILLGSFFIVMFLVSCKTRQKPAEKTSTIQIDSVKNEGHKVTTTLAFYEKVLIPPTFTQLKISGKMDLNIPDAYTPSLSSTLYIVQNERIWLNLNVLFVNVARAQVTPQGMEAYVKTERSYIRSDFQYINKLLNVNFIDYKTLEKLFIGRTFVKLNTREYQMHKTQDGYTLVSIVPQRFGTSDEKGIYNVSLEYSDNYDLKKVDLQEVQTKNRLLIEYSEWIDFEQIRLPKYVKIIIKGEKSGEILIENTKFENQKMNTPFSIPKNYSKIDIK